MTLVISKTPQKSDLWQTFNGNFNRSTPEQVPQMKNVSRKFSSLGWQKAFLENILSF